MSIHDVAVNDSKTGDSFSLEVHEGERALDVFHHPYAYAASRSSLFCFNASMMMGIRTSRCFDSSGLLTSASSDNVSMYAILMLSTAYTHTPPPPCWMSLSWFTSSSNTGFTYASIRLEVEWMASPSSCTASSRFETAR